MTTTVTIEAHCSDDKEVVISQYNPTSGHINSEVIQNGEKRIVYAHDTNQVSVIEMTKVNGNVQ